MLEGRALMAPGSDSPSAANPQPLVLEVFSNSERAWHVGIIMGKQDGMVTVRFLGAGGEKRQKAAFQQDPMFAQFGTYIGDQLPPGVVKVPSTTRPGQYSFFDQSAQRKFATLELVWHAYLEKRLIDEEASSPTATSQHMAAMSAPVATTMQASAPVASPIDKAPLSPRGSPLPAPPPAAARCTPEGPMVTPKGFSPSGAEPVAASADRDGYRPEGPMLTPPGSPRRGWGHGGWQTKMPPGASALPQRNMSHVGPGSNMPPPTQPFGSDNGLPLYEWVAQYVHQPVLTTAGINYLNQISIVFAAFAELFSPLAAANASHRERLIHAIESGAFMRATVDVFNQWDASGCNQTLTWENGVILGFVTAVFTQYGLSAPVESQMQGIVQAFDIRKQSVLGARECVLLVDAVARIIFRINATPGVSEERSLGQPVMYGGVAEERSLSQPVMLDMPRLDMAVPEPPPLHHPQDEAIMDFKQVESPCELHGVELMKALSTAVIGGSPMTSRSTELPPVVGPPLSMLLGGGFRRTDPTEAGPVQPFVYSNLADKGQETGPTQVMGVGLVEGATSIARLLIQRVPTSVLSGSAEGNAVRLRLQNKIAAMQAAAARHISTST